MRRASVVALGLAVVFLAGCRRPAASSEAPREPSEARQLATSPPELEAVDAQDSEDEEEYEYEYEEDREGWAMLPEDAPAEPTGVAEVDAAIHEEVGFTVCFGGTSSGDLDGVGPKDWAVGFLACETGERLGSAVYLVGPSGAVTELEPPEVGGYGGFPEFDRMKDGERVLLLRDSCCDTVTYGIVHLRGGELVLGVTVMGEEVEVRRDDQGRIVELVRTR